MKQLKIAALATLALTTLIIVLQNTEPVAIKLLFFDAIQIPAALLLFATGSSASFSAWPRRSSSVGAASRLVQGRPSCAVDAGGLGRGTNTGQFPLLRPTLGAA